ncbi:MAG: uracil-DNA glycosylase [Salinivirgaceae bacterium]
MSVLLNSLHKPVAQDWKGFLTTENQKLIEFAEKQLSTDDYTPAANRVLHFLTVPLSGIKAVILGQDPYPQRGVATGRSFEVGTLSDWNQPFRNVSLKNILRLIYKTYYGDEVSYKSIVSKNNTDPFILPPTQLFKNWEKQGVLLLNTAFTCEIGNSGSHAKYWKPFSDKLLSYLAQEKPDLHWILWGGHAQKITKELPIKYRHQSNHPMMCSKKNEADFLFGKYNTLAPTAEQIDWRGIGGV